MIEILIKDNDNNNKLPYDYMISKYTDFTYTKKIVTCIFFNILISIFTPLINRSKQHFYSHIS